MLTIAYVFKLWPSIVGHTNSVFFFYIGSYLSIIKGNVLGLFQAVEKVNYAITFILCVTCLWFYVSCMENYRALMPIYTISSLVSIINVSSRLVRNTSNIWEYLKKRVFFIYASHTLFFVSFVEVWLYNVLQHQPISILFAIYLLMLFLKIMICVTVFNLMAKYMPKSLAVLNGGRKSMGS